MIEFMAGVMELTEIAVPMIPWLEDAGFTVDDWTANSRPSALATRPAR
jgi:hypothetical protein